MRRRTAILGLAILCAAGCSTRRTLTIHSEPPGARVWVEGRDLGPAPVTVPFTHYGDFEVRMEKPGHHPWSGTVSVPSRIDGYPIVDLPYELTVRARAFRWTGRLEPIGAPTEGDARAALDRAKAFRERTHREVAEPDTPGRIPR